jgi:citrate lyase gamma subunit
MEQHNMATPPPPAGSTIQPPNQPPSQAEVEYRELRKFLETLVKWSAGAISTIVVLAGALFFGSVWNVTKDANRAIQATRESATHEISDIGKAAQTTARLEAQKAIDDAFEKQNVQHLIESTAQRKVDAAVELAVKKDLGAKVDAFRNLVIEIGEINNCGAQLRLEYQAGLECLLRARENSDTAVRTYAESTFKLIGADYEYSVSHTPFPSLDVAMYTTSLPTQFNPKQLMQMIHNAQDPHGPMKIALLFATMKGKVAWDVPMLDVPAAEKWCAEHKPRCEQDSPPAPPQPPQAAQPQTQTPKP